VRIENAKSLYQNVLTSACGMYRVYSWGMSKK